jgi:uncharacterized membrane protein YcjF (UPF0283 family)
MNNEEKNKIEEEYLPEDQKLLDELSKMGSLNTGAVNDSQKVNLQIAQIKATLRSRKSFDKADKSTTRFSYIFAAFAMIQIIIALFQFILQSADSSSKIFALVMAIALTLFIVFVMNSFDKILKDK